MTACQVCPCKLHLLQAQLHLAHPASELATVTKFEGLHSLWQNVKPIQVGYR